MYVIPVAGYNTCSAARVQHAYNGIKLDKNSPMYNTKLHNNNGKYRDLHARSV